MRLPQLLYIVQVESWHGQNEGVRCREGNTRSFFTFAAITLGVVTFDPESFLKKILWVW